MTIKDIIEKLEVDLKECQQTINSLEKLGIEQNTVIEYNIASCRYWYAHNLLKWIKSNLEENN